MFKGSRKRQGAVTALAAAVLGLTGASQARAANIYDDLKTSKVFVIAKLWVWDVRDTVQVVNSWGDQYTDASVELHARNAAGERVPFYMYIESQRRWIRTTKGAVCATASQAQDRLSRDRTDCRYDFGAATELRYQLSLKKFSTTVASKSGRVDLTRGR